jgi:hypothetical protein
VIIINGVDKSIGNSLLPNDVLERLGSVLTG